MGDKIDLGSDHWMEYYGWFPDRDLNPQYANIPDAPKAGLLVGHKRKDNGQECWSGIQFDISPLEQVFPDNARWKVESWEPLTLSPSLLCRACGDHGFIRKGRWVDA